MPSKRFTLIEHVILALLIAILARMAVPTLSASLAKLRASREQAYVASMKTDLVQLVMAEENYLRDSLKYTSDVRCTTPPTRGVLNFCPSRGNVLGRPTVNGSGGDPGWWVTMTNITLPTVTCAIFVNTGAPYPALVEGIPACRGPGWSGRADDTTGQIK